MEHSLKAVSLTWTRRWGLAFILPGAFALPSRGSFSPERWRWTHCHSASLKAERDWSSSVSSLGPCIHSSLSPVPSSWHIATEVWARPKYKHHTGGLLVPAPPCYGNPNRSCLLVCCRVLSFTNTHWVPEVLCFINILFSVLSSIKTSSFSAAWPGVCLGWMPPDELIN